MTTNNTVYKAWIKARSNREIEQGPIFHSYRVVQYTSNKIVQIINLNSKVTQSMSRKGNCWDNAVTESFFELSNMNVLIDIIFTKTEQLYKCIDQYVNWYNTKRIHSTLGYSTLLEMEVKNNKYRKVA